MPRLTSEQARRLRRYFTQLTVGCATAPCTNPHCLSSGDRFLYKLRLSSVDDATRKARAGEIALRLATRDATYFCDEAAAVATPSPSRPSLKRILARAIDEHKLLGGSGFVMEPGMGACTAPLDLDALHALAARSHALSPLPYGERELKDIIESFQHPRRPLQALEEMDDFMQGHANDEAEAIENASVFFSCCPLPIRQLFNRVVAGALEASPSRSHSFVSPRAVDALTLILAASTDGSDSDFALRVILPALSLISRDPSHRQLFSQALTNAIDATLRRDPPVSAGADLQWPRKRAATMLAKLVGDAQQQLTMTLVTAQGRFTQVDAQNMSLLAEHLQMLSEINDNFRRLVDPSEWHNSVVNELPTPTRHRRELNYDLLHDFVTFLRLRARNTTPGDAGVFSFMDYPMLLSPASKVAFMRAETHAMQEPVLDFMTMIGARSPYFVLRVRRSHLLEDALSQLQLAAVRAPGSLKRRLKVVFEGEEAIDEGGPAKELMQLVCQSLMSPDYGMFTVIPGDDCDAGECIWFSKSAPRDVEPEFRLVGQVLGLCIYNGILVDARFAPVVYKKLAGAKTSLDDLPSVSLRRGLEALREYALDDVEDVFCLTFSVDEQSFGQTRTVDLKPNGRNVGVTADNKHEFLTRRVAYELDEAVSWQVSAFAQGFHEVADCSSLSLFRPDELELAIVGSPELDFEALRKNTKYEGFTANSKEMKWFWDIVLNDFSPAQRARLLFFATGSDRAPLQGLGAAQFIIMRQGGEGDQRLPTAHTCFSVLQIPAYSSRAVMKDRLLLAVENATGFGLR
jgi:ubiquitin-protein ligase E3 A